MSSVIRFDRLSCGMPACIQSSGESQLASISVWINAGSARDPVGKGGLAHLCEHLLLRPLAQPDSRLRRLQLRTGALVDAYTDPEWVVVSAQAPVDQTQPLVDLLSALVCDPCCEPCDVEVEKEAILHELRETEPGSAERLASIFRKSAFAGDPCVQPVGGTPATLGAIQPGDAQAYYSRYLNASKTLITAHGGIAVSDLADIMDEAFKDFPQTSTSRDYPGNELATATWPPPTYRPIRVHRKASITASTSSYGVLAGFGSVARTTEEYWTALAFEVFMADGSGSLLTQWLRDERRWIYGAASMTEAFSNWGNQYFLMRLCVSPDRAEEAVNYLGQQWQALPELVTGERMEALRNRLASRALSSLAGLQDRMTLMRDTVLAETRESGTLEGGLEAIVGRYARELTSASLLSYIRQHAEWDRVSLVCAPI